MVMMKVKKQTRDNERMRAVRERERERKRRVDSIKKAIDNAMLTHTDKIDDDNADD